MVSSYRRHAVQLKGGALCRFSASSIHADLPPAGGVYAVVENIASRARIVYCGKAKDLNQRLYRNLLMGQARSHTLSSKLMQARRLKDKPAAKRYFMNHCAVRFSLESDPRERAFVEHYLISLFRPEFND